MYKYIFLIMALIFFNGLIAQDFNFNEFIDIWRQK